MTKSCGKSMLVQLGTTITAPAWVTATVYTVGQFVTETAVVYECVVGHTAAASFATDAAKWRVATDPVSFGTVGGGRSDSVTIDGEAVDVTDKGSERWRELLSGCGIRSINISWSGLMTNGTAVRAIRQLALSQALNRFRLIDGFGSVYAGYFQVRNFETSGEHNDAQQASFSLESSGEILVVDPA